MRKYGIYNKMTKQYFAGFAKDNSVLWSDKAGALTRTNRQDVYGQALALAMKSAGVQKKPVLIAA